MFVLKAQGVTKEWNGKRLFENVSLEVSVGERVALVGRNGVGKTSLIEGLMGRVEFDGGGIQRGIPLEEWGWIEQEIHVGSEVTLFDFAYSGQTDLYRVKQQLDRIQHVVERGAGQDKTLQVYSDMVNRYADLGGYDVEVQVERTLKRLGLDSSQFHDSYHNLSGGQKTRAQLAKLLVKNPRFLVLDEPTNHLDIETLEWLEEWLRGYRGSVLMVSHDRSLMDAIVDTTYELTPTGTKRYTGGYSAYRLAQEVEMRTQQALHEKQERARRELLMAIQRYKQWYEKAHNAASERDPVAKKKAQKNSTRFKAKERALERLEAQQVERPQGRFQMDLAFDRSKFAAKTLVRLEDVDFSYPGRDLFRNVQLEVNRGDRIGILGANGAGKSTLLNLVTGNLEPTSGRITHHPEAKIGYFAQELGNLEGQRTILETVLGLPGMTQTYARTVLAGFLFRDDEVYKRIDTLSMGERCRVAFVNLYFSSANLLVLDEPTNHLDIETRERLEEALEQYPGALMVVSHDRALLGKLVNRIVYFDHWTVRSFQGTYEDFLSHDGS